jgi:hypothetical protein
MAGFEEASSVPFVDAYCVRYEALIDATRVEPEIREAVATAQGLERIFCRSLTIVEMNFFIRTLNYY